MLESKKQKFDSLGLLTKTQQQQSKHGNGDDDDDDDEEGMAEVFSEENSLNMTPDDDDLEDE